MTLYSQVLFKSHGLQEQSAAGLMDRVETKFVIQTESVNQYLEVFSNDYSILQINNQSIFNYDSCYFDTNDMGFYKAHHNGKLNRQKVRLRRYRETGAIFMEIKTKTNKQRTHKDRIQLHTDEQQVDRMSLFIESTIGIAYKDLIPVVDVNYQRLTLMGLDSNERVTIDTGLQFRSLKSKQLVSLPNLAIVEIKSPNKSRASIAYRELLNCGEKEQKFSKYCVAISLTDTSGLKKNRFKPVLRKIEKLVKTSQLENNIQNENVKQFLHPNFSNTQNQQELIV